MKLVGGEFTGTDKHEALEIVGKANVIVRRCHFTGGATLLRFVDCVNVLVDNCTFDNALGPPDPDGQCIQFIRTDGTITGCQFRASPQSEDLVSIYSDKPMAPTKRVVVRSCVFLGRGATDSGTSLCCDGPYAPTTIIDGCQFMGARCGITLAGGVGHRISGTNKFDKCDTDIYTHQFYPEAGDHRFGNFIIDPRFKVLT